MELPTIKERIDRLQYLKRTIRRLTDEFNDAAILLELHIESVIDNICLDKFPSYEFEWIINFHDGSLDLPMIGLKSFTPFKEYRKDEKLPEKITQMGLDILILEIERTINIKVVNFIDIY